LTIDFKFIRYAVLYNKPLNILNQLFPTKFSEKLAVILSSYHTSVYIFRKTFCFWIFSIQLIIYSNTKFITYDIRRIYQKSFLKPFNKYQKRARVKTYYAKKGAYKNDEEMCWQLILLFIQYANATGKKLLTVIVLIVISNRA